MIDFSDLVVKSASSGLRLQRSDGSFVAGHNGPWNVEETPVRNTCHWLIQCAKAYELTRQEKFLEALERAVQYLLLPEARPFGFTFHIMKEKYWETNGLVGQAWVMEAFITAHRILHDDELLSIPEELAKMHAFDQKLHLWRKLSLEGNDNGEHTTLNQQLWFWAMVLQIATVKNDEVLLERCHLFAKNLPSLMRFNDRFLHMLINEKIYLPTDPGSFLKQFYRIHKSKKLFHALSKGYITYSLYPFAIVVKQAPSLGISENPKLRYIVNSCMEYLEEVVFHYVREDNPYAFTYHPTGLEAACIVKTFQSLRKSNVSVEDWLGKQIRNHFDFESGLLKKNTCDAHTLSARMYEHYQLSDLHLQIPD